MKEIERANRPAENTERTTGNGNSSSRNTGNPSVSLNPTPPPVDPHSTGEVEFLTEIIPLINDERKVGKTCGNEIFEPANELAWDKDLAEAALEHAADLTFHRGMQGHRGSDSTRVIQRIRRHSTDFSNFAENVVLGNLSAENSFRVFLNSPGHCRNIMNYVYTHVGAAKHYNPETGRTATVYKFGRKRGIDIGPKRERKFVDTIQEDG
ncbi:CAP domain-containing protein [Mongoliibacter sp.]|uniref:CAP domain-containing protein n=1 Tax=Mongoliibacter sp. TaxID=2022438 RepID=UPI0025F41FE6|nr:CAP domain-containing protein [Mongoliibacter sp.]